MNKEFIFVLVVVFGLGFVIPSLLEINGYHYAASVLMTAALIAVLIQIPFALLRRGK